MSHAKMYNHLDGPGPARVHARGAADVFVARSCVWPRASHFQQIVSLPNTSILAPMFYNKNFVDTTSRPNLSSHDTGMPYHTASLSKFWMCVLDFPNKNDATDFCKP